MAIPATPNNVYLQTGNGQNLLSWDLVAGAVTYSVQRSTDGVNYTTVATPTANQYLDTAVIVATNYYYQVASTNASGTGVYSAPQSIVPTLVGTVSLGLLRLWAQQRADRVNSKFVTLPEWNSYISQSYFELYDLLVATYGPEYYLKTPYTVSTDGVNSQFTLPNDFYKLLGVDLGLNGTGNAFLTLHNFDFIERNRYVFPQITASYLGVFNMRYRLMGNTLYFIPVPSAGQFLRIWYVPRMPQPLLDTDIIDGVNGWTEYIVVDAAIKALQKEESDVSVLAAEKLDIRARIETMAQNRDIGESETISDTRSFAGRGSGYGFGGWDGGGMGGW